MHQQGFKLQVKAIKDLTFTSHWVTHWGVWTVTFEHHWRSTASTLCLTNLIPLRPIQSSVHNRGSESCMNLHMRYIYCQLALQLISILIYSDILLHLHLFIRKMLSSFASCVRCLSVSLPGIKLYNDRRVFLWSRKEDCC